MSSKRHRGIPRRTWLTHPYAPEKDGTALRADSFALFDYIQAERMPLTQQNLSYERVGEMLETYVDALHVPLVLAEPDFIAAMEEGADKVRDPTFFANRKHKPLSFLRETFGDYRAFSSFFRGDMAMVGQGPWLQGGRKQAQAAAFAQEAHAQLRQAATSYGKKFSLPLDFYPPPGESNAAGQGYNRADFKTIRQAVETFKSLQAEYPKVYKAFSSKPRPEAKTRRFDPAENSPRIAGIEKRASDFRDFLKSSEFSHIEGQLSGAIDDLIWALSSSDAGGLLERFYLKYGGKYLVVDNGQKLDERFSLSYPALILLSLQYKGRHDVDRTFASKQSFDLFSHVLGVESQITRQLQRLNDKVIVPALKAQGIEPPEDLLYGTGQRADFVEMVRKNSRGIRLLYTFHKTAGQMARIYPREQGDIACRDMERMLALAGIGDPWVTRLEKPCEVASMLYAVERRLTLSGGVNKASAQCMGELRSLADRIGKAYDFNNVRPQDREALEKAVEQYVDSSEAFIHAAALLRDACMQMRVAKWRQGMSKGCMGL